MKFVTRRSRSLLLASFMLLSVVALSRAYAPTPVVATVVDTCQECQFQCSEEGHRVRQECIRNGGAWEYCLSKGRQYRDNCESVFCNYGGMCVGGAPTPVEPINDGLTAAGFDEFEACIAAAHQARQECGSSQACTEEYNSSVSACESQGRQ